MYHCYFPDTCGIRYYGRNPGRIVDGQTAAKNSWPWQVQIITPYGQHHCGGSVLTDEWIATAAHCIGSTTKGYTVKLGKMPVEVYTLNSKNVGENS